MLTLLFFIGKEQRMARKFTPMQELFRHEQQRLRRAIAREYRTTGVELDKNLIPEMPKRVTQKQLENIRQIRPRNLRYETTYYDPEDLDRQIKYPEAKRIWQEEQRQVNVVPQIDFNNTVIDSFLNSLEKYNQNFQLKIKAWINQLISQYGEDAVAQMLMEGAENGVIVTTQIAYNDEACSAYMAEMLTYLNPNARTKADILAEIESSVGYTEPE